MNTGKHPPRRASVLIALLLLWQASASLAAYTPDVAEFDGSSTLAFPPAEELFLGAGGTIEFWVVPDWQASVAHDPVVLSNAGPEGASYLVAVLRDRDGLVLVSGEAEFLIAFDFADEQLHHVALVYDGGRVAAYIDGQLRGATEFAMVDLPSLGLWIGTADGATAPFVGAIAGLRIWGVPLSREEIVSFAAADVLAAGEGHPAYQHLLAVSDFNNDDLLVTKPDPADR